MFRKQVVRYQAFSITKKLRVEVRIVVDKERSPEFISNYNGDKYTTISLQPLITINLTRQAELDENGNRERAAWNPNDNLLMTKYTLPIFVSELSGIQQDFRRPELYKYTDKRLEINEIMAEKIRRAFMIGNMTVELSAVVIITDEGVEEKRVEGIQMKFNNKFSSVLLTLNDVESMLFNLRNLNIDMIALLMYTAFIKKMEEPQTPTTSKNEIDIAPLTHPYIPMPLEINVTPL